MAAWQILIIVLATILVLSIGVLSLRDRRSEDPNRKHDSPG